MYLGKTVDGYVRAIKDMPFSYLKSLSKGYKFISWSLTGSQIHKNLKFLSKKGHNFRKFRPKFGESHEISEKIDQTFEKIDQDLEKNLSKGPKNVKIQSL